MTAIAISVALLIMTAVAAGLWLAYRRSEAARRRLAEAADRLGHDPDRALLPHVHQILTLGRMLGGAAHDVNNALAVMMMNVEIMQQDQALAEKHGRRLGLMMDATQRGTGLTRHLLRFSHRKTFEPDVVCLTDVLTPLVELMRAALGKDFELQIVANEGSWNTRIDVSAFEVTTLHLAMRAADAMPEGGTIEIEIGNLSLRDAPARRSTDLPRGDYVVLTISGPRADRPSSAAAGDWSLLGSFGPNRGLGMVESFAEKAGGHVRTAEHPPGLEQVTLYLPRCNETGTV